LPNDPLPITLSFSKSSLETANSFEDADLSLNVYLYICDFLDIMLSLTKVTLGVKLLSSKDVSWSKFLFRFFAMLSVYVFIESTGLLICLLLFALARSLRVPADCLN